MIIKPIGTGSALSKRFFNNNYLIEFENYKLLIDAGSSLKYGLQAADVSYGDIDYVFITHFHFDHAGGIEELLTNNYWTFKDGKHSPKLTKFIILEPQVSNYNNLLSPGLSNQNMCYTDYMETITLSNQSTLQIGSYEFEFIDTSDLHCLGMQSYGIHIKNRNTGANIIFTSDIQNLEKSSIRERINDYTVAIFQDVSFSYNPVHAFFDDILLYYPKKYYSLLYLMHYGDDIDKFLPIIKNYGMNVVQQKKDLNLL